MESCLSLYTFNTEKAVAWLTLLIVIQLPTGCSRLCLPPAGEVYVACSASPVTHGTRAWLPRCGFDCRHHARAFTARFAWLVVLLFTRYAFCYAVCTLYICCPAVAVRSPCGFIRLATFPVYSSVRLRLFRSYGSVVAAGLFCGYHYAAAAPACLCCTRRGRCCHGPPLSNTRDTASGRTRYRALDGATPSLVVTLVPAAAAGFCGLVWVVRYRASALLEPRATASSGLRFVVPAL